VPEVKASVKVGEKGAATAIKRWGGAGKANRGSAERIIRERAKGGNV